MKRLLGVWLVLTAPAAGALLLAWLLAPGRFELELDVFILFAGAVAVLNVVLVARGAYPREEQSALAEALEREPDEPLRPAELQRLERELTMAVATAFDVHVRLRPVVREIAGTRLAARGLRLDNGEEVLGEELWELVRDDRPMPAQRHADGISRDALERVVERLETL
ncbi:MAG: hypothetical protein ACJ76O_13895 [Gaiellaceae bacterium]